MNKISDLEYKQLLELSHQGRTAEAQFSDRFKAQHNNWKEIEPIPVYFEDGTPYLGKMPDDYFDQFKLDTTGKVLDMVV